MSLHEVPFRSSALDHMIASYKGALTAVLLDQIADSPAAGSMQVCAYTRTLRLPRWLCLPASIACIVRGVARRVAVVAGWYELST